MAGNQDGGSPRHAHPGLYRRSNFIQMDVSGNDLIEGTDHTDQGAAQFFVGISHGIEKGAGWGPAPAL